MRFRFINSASAYSSLGPCFGSLRHPSILGLGMRVPESRHSVFVELFGPTYGLLEGMVAVCFGQLGLHRMLHHRTMAGLSRPRLAYGSRTVPGPSALTIPRRS